MNTERSAGPASGLLGHLNKSAKSISDNTGFVEHEDSLHIPVGV